MEKEGAVPELWGRSLDLHLAGDSPLCVRPRAEGERIDSRRASRQSPRQRSMAFGGDVLA